jgi:surface polysaccharide O-acyltransferase-like enzyme
MNFIIYNNQFILENLFVIFGLIILLFIPRYASIFWDIDSSYNYINKKRLKSIDTIKGISIIAVILIHTCDLLYSQYTSMSDIITLNSINNISRFAIPVFLFTSGLLLKPFIWKKEYIYNFYRSKFIRIIIPYIIVNFILWIFDYNNNNRPLWQLVLTGDMAVPFYFIPVLVQLYLSYPILDMIRKISPKYLLLGSLIISVISFLVPSTWNLYGVPLFTQYLIFFVYGMVRKDVFNKKISNIWVELIFIYIILQAIFNIGIFYNNFYISNYKFLYFYNFQIIFGFGFIFSILKHLQSNKFNSQLLQNIFSPIGKMSLWIFLIHFPIQQILVNNIMELNLSLSIKLIQNFILTSCISIILAFILVKIYDIPKLVIKYFTKK